MTTTTTARGTCSICGNRYGLTKDGKLRTHWEPGTSHRCLGSGWPPAGSTTVPSAR